MLLIAFFLLWNLHSLRGIGWNWGARLDRLPPPLPLHPTGFALAAATRALASHIGVALGVALATASAQAGSPAALVSRTLGLDSSSSTNASTSLLVRVPAEALVTFLYGVVAWAGLTLGHTLVALIAFALSRLRRSSPSSSSSSSSSSALWEFDARTWPPLLNKPYAATSLESFWSSHWHVLFRAPFRAVGFFPAVALVRSLAAACSSRCFSSSSSSSSSASSDKDKDNAKRRQERRRAVTAGELVAGTLAVFALSGAMHEFGKNKSVSLYFLLSGSIGRIY
jgi:hypothetical protein